MRQESGGSMIAAARMNARAGMWRTRRRIAIGGALTAALAAGALSFGVAGAGGKQPDQKSTQIVLTVNTTKDLVAEEGKTGADPTSLLAACLRSQDDAADGGAMPLSVGSTLGTQEGEINKNPGVPQSDNIRPCSLRMALLAAGALNPVESVSSPGVTTLSVKIYVDEKTQGKTLQIDPGALNPPVRASLPPIRGTNVEIDGCGGATNPPGPCVNLDLRALQAAGNVDPVDGVPTAMPGLIAGADQTTIKGFAFQDGRGPAILMPPFPISSGTVPQLPGELTVENSYFGLELGEKNASGSGFVAKDAVAPAVGVQVSGFDAGIARNVFAGDGDRDESSVGVLIAGGSRAVVAGNRFGTNASGVADADFGLGAGVRLTGLYGADASRIARNVNEAVGESAVDTAVESGLMLVAGENTIGGKLEAAHAATKTACDGTCNVFAGSRVAAIDVGGGPLTTSAAIVNTRRQSSNVGVRDTTIASNWIGIDAAGKKGVNKASGILVRNGSSDTTIGGSTQDEFGNVISQNQESGVTVMEPNDVAVQDGAGLGTQFLRNTGQGNTMLLLDLGGNGKAGNDPENGPSGGIQAPQITGALPTSVSGTAEPGSTVHVYLAPGSRESEIEKFLGEVRATNGTWSLTIPASGGRYVTATATINGLGTSELAANALVPEPPKPAKPADPPPPPPPPDVTAPVVKTVAGQDPEKGPVVLTPDKLKTLSGQVADESGVARVRIALQVLSLQSARRAHAAKRERICRFVHLSKARLLRRPCSRPPYRTAQLHEAQSGDTAWRLPLSAKVRKRLKAGRYRLLVETTDTNGLATVHRVPVVIKKKARRGRR